MRIHAKIITLVSLGILLIMGITMYALENITGALSRTHQETGEQFGEFQRLWTIEQGVTDMALAVHDYLETGDVRYKARFASAHFRAHDTLQSLGLLDLSPKERAVYGALTANLAALESRGAVVFSRPPPGTQDRIRVARTMQEIDGLLGTIRSEIETYHEENAIRMGGMVMRLLDHKRRINTLFLLVLITAVVFLFLFGLYLHRTISAPLNRLRKGAAEISKGNLDYQIRQPGAGDVARLAEQFDEMAQQVKHLYTALEEKLLLRTNELAAIDSVAFTLSRSGSLPDVLAKSLDQILASLAGLEPRGGVFLCDPNGETLRLVAHRGLTEEFVRQEETIRMGECLCGRAAETGEILFSEDGCRDPHHTRGGGADPHSHIIIPVKARGIVLGVVFLYPQKTFSLKPSDVQMLDTIGAQLGMAVENLRFYAEVKESSEKYWDLFENARDLFFTIDEEGVVTAANRETEHFSGFAKPDLVGMSIFEFLAGRDADRARRMLRGEEGGARPVEFEVHRRDGTRAFLEVSVRKLSGGRTQAVGYQLSGRDVTERKQMREKLVQAERLGAIGEIVIAVRHEVNNPLTAVIGNVELLIERYGREDPDLAARLEVVLNNALRIAEIVQRLQEIKRDKVVEYVRGVKMTDLKQGQDGKDGR